MPNLGIGRVIEMNSVGSTAVLVTGCAHEVTVTAIRAINTTAALAHVQLFDAAAASDVTVGTTVPRWVVTSAASSASDGDGLANGGIRFVNGLVIASTTGVANNTGATQHVRIAVV